MTEWLIFYVMVAHTTFLGMVACDSPRTNRARAPLDFSDYVIIAGLAWIWPLTFGMFVGLFVAQVVALHRYHRKLLDEIAEARIKK